VINQFLFLFVTGPSHNALGVLNCNSLCVSSLDCLERKLGAFNSPSEGGVFHQFCVCTRELCVLNIE
jgi:hypothetical protein